MSKQDGEAQLHYGDGEYALLRPGRFVRCAVSQKPISLEGLRYWSVERQEPYSGPAEFLQQLQETR